MKLPNWIRQAALKVASTGAQFESGKRESRSRGTIPGGTPSGLKYDLPAYTRQEILKRSRYIARNSGFQAEIKSLMAVYAIGDGMRPQAKSPDTDWNAEAERLFNEWSFRAEITNRFNFFEVQHLVSRALDDDGEIFAVKTFDLYENPKLQIVETHAIDCKTDAEKNLFDGIQFDAVGRPVSYMLRSRKMGDPSVSLPASGVIHVFEPQSVSMSRAFPSGQHGLTKMQDVMELLAMETHATKDAAEVSRVLKSNRERALSDGDFSLDSEGDNSEMTTDEAAVAAAIGGRIVRINTDEELNSFNSNRPNAMFQGFLDTLNREASGGKLPFEVLWDASKVGGASVRLVVSKADRQFQYRQGVMKTRFLTPVWGYVIGSFINAGILPAVKGWNRVDWTTPRRITVDAGREAQANRLDVESGLKTWADDIAERGGDFDEWLRERSDQARKIMGAAGMDASEPIPLWMIYKPSGMALQTQTTEIE